MSVLTQITALQKQGNKGIAVLVDPDKAGIDHLKKVCQACEKNSVDFIFVGSSMLLNGNQDQTISEIKKHTQIPVVIFPGGVFQLSPKADSVLFLSLISGRNPEFLISKQVSAAPLMKSMNIDSIPTGYLLIDCGKTTTAHYITDTQPIPHDKEEIAACTAYAGELLGLKLLYLDGGSGAKRTVSPDMIKTVSGYSSLPIIVGGGIKTVEQAKEIWGSGASLIVLGTVFEKKTKNLSLLEQLDEVRNEINENS